MKLCPRCQTELPDNARFCLQCGYTLPKDSDGQGQAPAAGPSQQEALSPPRPPSPDAPPAASAPPEPEPKPEPEPGAGAASASSTPDYQPGSADWQALYPLIGSHQDYYFRQFMRLEQFGTASFNWAVFFFGPLVSLYRKSYAFFRRYYLGPMILSYASMGLLLLSLWQYQPVGLILSAFLLFGGGIWSLIAAILGGQRFNRRYYEQITACRQQTASGVPGRAKGGVSGGGVAIYVVIVVMLNLVFSILAGFSVFRLTDFSRYDSYRQDGPFDDSYWSGSVDTRTYDEVAGCYLLPDNNMYLDLKGDGTALLHLYGSCGIPAAVEVEETGTDFITVTLTVPESHWSYLEINGNGDQVATLTFQISDDQITQLTIDGVTCSFYRSSEENFYHTLRSTLESTAAEYLADGYYAIAGEPVFQDHQLSAQIGVLAEDNVYPASEYYIDDDYTLWLLIYSSYSNANVWVIPY